MAWSFPLLDAEVPALPDHLTVWVQVAMILVHLVSAREFCPAWVVLVLVLPAAVWVVPVLLPKRGSTRLPVQKCLSWSH